MKIIIATTLLFDKTSPFNHLLKDILKGLVESGHEIVRIVACENNADESYKMGMEFDTITYVPVVCKKSEKANIIVRYLRDTLAAVKMAKYIRTYSADVLFEDALYNSFWTVRAAKKVKMRVVSMLQDIWPDNAVQSGLISAGSLIYKYFEFWQKKVYQKSDKLICISDDMKAFIASKGVPENKISVIYNWGYTDDIVDIPWEENEFVKKYSLARDYFYAIYAGNIGRMQNVELILKSADKLKDNDKIKFLIVGDGVRSEAIKQMANEMNLTNTIFLPLQPPELATSIYSAAGVNIIPLVPGGVKTALPSKTGVCLSCGRPIVFCFGNDCRFADLVNKYNSGHCVSADNPNELVVEIEKASQNTSYKKIYSLFKKEFIRSDNIRKYVKELSKK